MVDLDGYIVDEADSLDWLNSRDVDQTGPFNYDEFIATIGTVVMGSATQERIIAIHPGPWMHEQLSWVLTRRPDIVADGHSVQTFDGAVTRVASQAGCPRRRVRTSGVVGGGHIAAQFVSAGPVDEMIVRYAPCSLGAGLRALPVRSKWVLVDSAVNREFVCARWHRA